MKTEQQFDAAATDVEISEITESASALIWEWHTVAKALAKMKKQEARLRAVVFSAFFKDSPLGTNTLALPEDWQLKCVKKENVKLDERALPSVLEELGEGFEDKLIKYKPSIIAAAYKELAEDEQAVFDEAVITTPASPSISLISPEG